VANRNEIRIPGSTTAMNVTVVVVVFTAQSIDELGIAKANCLVCPSVCLSVCDVEVS